MKTFTQLTEEIANSMGGTFKTGQVGVPGNIAGIDGHVMGVHRRKKKRRGLGEMFAGCPVFEVSSDDFTKCSHGRNRYERWGKKMNMEEADNQDIRAYAHRNPGKPVIIKDSTYGTMSYLIPRQNVNESLGGPGGPSRNMSPNDMYTSGLRTKALLKKLQDKTTAAYVRQKTELEPGPKTAKYNKLADKLDKLKKKKGNKK